MNQRSPLRVACIGTGYFSTFHIDAWHRIAEAVPVAAADINIDKARATGLAAYESVPTMLRETSPDIVDIISPPDTHLEFILAALEHGVRAVICQKPFCGSRAEAERALQLSKSAGIPILVHENFRFQPWYRVIKTAIRSGEIGRLLQVTFRLRPGDGQGREAYLSRQPYFQSMPRFLVHETAIHWIDTFRFLLGEPVEVFADLRRLNPVIAGEDAGYILFSYEDGVRALFDGNRLLDHDAGDTRCTMGEMLVEGTLGTLSLQGDGGVTLRRFGDNHTEVLHAGRTYRGFGGDCVYQLQKHVVSGLLDGTPLENTVSDYMPNIVLEELIYRSADEGRKLKVDPRA